MSTDIPTKEDQETCRAIGFDLRPNRLDKLSPSVRKIAIHLQDHDLIACWIDQMKQFAQMISGVDDGELADHLWRDIDVNHKKAVPLAKRQEVINSIRETMSWVNTSLAYKDVKKILNLIAAGMQISYEDFGSNASTKNVQLTRDLSIKNGMYLIPKDMYIPQGLPIPNAAPSSFDAIRISPKVLIDYYFEKATDKILERNDADLLLIKLGFEETYHAFQYKDPAKKQEVIEAARNRHEGLSHSGLFIDQMNTLSRSDYNAHHEKDFTEQDAEKELGTRKERFEAAASAVRCNVR